MAIKSNKKYMVNLTDTSYKNTTENNTAQTTVVSNAIPSQISTSANNVNALYNNQNTPINFTENTVDTSYKNNVAQKPLTLGDVIAADATQKKEQNTSYAETPKKSWGTGASASASASKYTPVNFTETTVDTSYKNNIINGGVQSPSVTENAENKGSTETSKEKPATENTVDTSYNNNIDKTQTSTENTDPNNESESSATSFQVSSYLDYLSKLPEKLESIYNDKINRIDENNQKAIEEINAMRDKALSYAENLKKSAYESADTSRARNIVDSRNSYEVNKATYGAKAEALASMGLTGGGYSNYLDAQAYAAHRAEIQAANANADKAKRSADNDYNDIAYQTEINADEAAAQARAEAEQAIYDLRNEYETTLLENQNNIASYTENMYLSILEGAIEGKYTVAQLNEFSQMYNFTEAQKNTLIQSVNQSENYSDMVTNIQYDPSSYTLSDYDDMVSNGTLTLDQAEKIKAEQKRIIYNEIVEKLNSGNVSDIAGAFSDVEVLLREGNIDEECYGEIKQLLNTPQGVNYLHDKGQLTNEEYIAKMSKIGVSSGMKINGGWYIQGLGSGRNNDDVDITIGSTKRKGDGKKEYDLLCGAKVTDETTLRALNTLATGDPDKTPSKENEGSGWFFGIGNHDMSSEDKPGKLVLYNSSLYLYTTKGWRILKSDNNVGEINAAIAAFISCIDYGDISGKNK